jgi:uncharacterized protein YkwD
MGTRRLQSLVSAALALAVVLCAPVGAAEASCAGADRQTSSAPQIQRAMLCLHNAERRARGVGALTANRALAQVAMRYSRRMVSGRFFSHSAGRRDHMDRIAAGGYDDGAGCWTAGENLFGAAGALSPRRLMRAWMHSPAHRATILMGGWRDFGLGVAAASPGGGPGLTIVTLFGTRSRRCS